MHGQAAAGRVYLLVVLDAAWATEDPCRLTRLRRRTDSPGTRSVSFTDRTYFVYVCVSVYSMCTLGIDSSDNIALCIVLFATW